MADQDTTVTVENGEVVDGKVETAKAEDENQLQDNQEDNTDTGEETEETESGDDDTHSEDDETNEETKAEFQKRFSQLKGETPEEYLKNLEDAYANSSTEGQRNAKKAKDLEKQVAQVAEFISKNPEFAEKFNSGTGENVTPPTVDPAVKWAKEQMEAEWSHDWTEFTKSHPSLAGDQAKLEELTAELDIIAAAHEKRGAKLSMAQGLKKAWISLGWEDENEVEDSKDTVAAKAREQASQGAPKAKTQTGADKPKFTDAQIATAKKFGLTVEDLVKHSKQNKE